MARAPAEQAQVVPAPPKPGGTHRPLSGTPPLHAREDGRQRRARRTVRAGAAGGGDVGKRELGRVLGERMMRKTVWRLPWNFPPRPQPHSGCGRVSMQRRGRSRWRGWGCGGGWSPSVRPRRMQTRGGAAQALHLLPRACAGSRRSGRRGRQPGAGGPRGLRPHVPGLPGTAGPTETESKLAGGRAGAGAMGSHCQRSPWIAGCSRFSGTTGQKGLRPQGHRTALAGPLAPGTPRGRLSAQRPSPGGQTALALRVVTGAVLCPHQNHHTVRFKMNFQGLSYILRRGRVRGWQRPTREASCTAATSRAGRRVAGRATPEPRGPHSEHMQGGDAPDAATRPSPGLAAASSARCPCPHREGQAPALRTAASKP